MVGEFDPTLKAEIDAVQEYIDFLWKWDAGRTNIVLKQIALKDKLTQKIGMVEVVCIYCKKHIKMKDGLGVTGISHGICDECEICLKNDPDYRGPGKEE